MVKKLSFEHLYFLCGLFLPLFLLLSHFSLLDHTFLLVLLLGIETIGYFILKKKFPQTTLFWMITIFGWIILWRHALSVGFMKIFNSIVDAYGIIIGLKIGKFNLSSIPLVQLERNSFLFLFTMFSVAMVILYQIVIVKKSALFTFLWTLLLTLPVFMIQIPMHWSWIIALFLFWGILALPSLKLSISSKIRRKQIVMMTLTIVITAETMMSILPESVVKQAYHPVSVKEKWIEKVNTWIQELSYIQYQDTEIDLTSAGNRYYANIPHFTVEMLNRKGMTLYLKTFSGSVFENNTWKSLPEGNYDMPYNGEVIDFDRTLMSMQRNAYSLSYQNEILINDFRKGNVYALQPYYLEGIEGEYHPLKDYALAIKQKDVHYVVWEGEPENFKNIVDTDYYQFVYDNYLSIDSTFPNFVENGLELKSYHELLEEYCEKSYGVDFDMDFITHLERFYFAFDLDYIQFVSDYICSVLKEYEYTLKPGNLPEGADFVHYFMLRNKKGYCVHFSTVATLLMRYYGVPARYVEGYRVKSDQFDSYGVAEVLDSDAHAWVEVYTEKVGWKPIEVTVGYLDEHEEEKKEEQQNPNRPTRPNQDRDPQDGNDSNPTLPENSEEKDKNSFRVDGQVLLPYFIVSGLIVGYVMVRYGVIARRKKKFTQRNRQKACLAMAQYLSKIDRYSPCLDASLIEIFEKNKFSSQGICEEEYCYVLDQVHTIPKTLYQNLKLHEKIVFKYIKWWI